MKKNKKTLTTAEHFKKISEENIDFNLMKAEEVEKRLHALYNGAISQINKRIDDVFYSYIRKFDLTKKQGFDLLNQPLSYFEREELLKDIAKIKNPTVRKRFLARLDKDAYLYRMNREELLKEHTRAIINQVAVEEELMGVALFTSTLPETYFKTVHIIQSFTEYKIIKDNKTHLVKKLTSKTWNGGNYSSRVWKNADILTQQLNDQIKAGILAGTDNRKLARMLKDNCDAGLYGARRLVRTEMSYLTNEAQLEAYKEEGVEKYVFLATLDLRTSKKCASLDLKKFKITEKEVGVNFPPMHPLCRSTVYPDIKKRKTNMSIRRAKDKLGNTIVVDGIMNYEQWRKKFID